MEDTFRDKGQRKQLVEVLKSKGIKDEQVLEAIGKIPRHLFFDKVFHHNFAYKDVAFPIGAGQTISQPYTVAFQTELLRIKKGMKVLEIGTGSGYQTAVLLEIGAKVHTIERQRELFQKTKILLPKLGYKANFYFGDGFIGKDVFAPYDRILVTCGAPFVPTDLIEQLSNTGRMVIPVGDDATQKMILLEKDEKGETTETEHGNFSFVPMLEDKQY